MNSMYIENYNSAKDYVNFLFDKFKIPFTYSKRRLYFEDDDYLNFIKFDNSYPDLYSGRCYSIEIGLFNYCNYYKYVESMDGLMWHCKFGSSSFDFVDGKILENKNYNYYVNDNARIVSHSKEIFLRQMKTIAFF